MTQLKAAIDMQARELSSSTETLRRPSAASYPDPRRRPGARKGPLTGVRVADFCWMGVGACATRLLADFGAQVIRIEDRNRLDMPRRLPIYKGEVRSYGEEEANPDPNKGGLFNNYNRNKLGVTINMRDARGKALADRLIAASSVVTENFAPGVMERWGLTYERLSLFQVVIGMVTALLVGTLNR
eukprot:gene19712-19609_t